MVDMDPADVQRVSRDLHAIGDDASAEVTKLFATGTAAAKGNPDWQCAAAMNRCVDAFRGAVDRTVNDVWSNAITIATAVSRTVALDQEGERRLRAVLKELANK